MIRSVAVGLLVGIPLLGNAGDKSSGLVPTGGAPRAGEPADRLEWVAREVAAMGTRLRIRVEAETRAGGLEAIEDAVSAVGEVEAVLSSWASSSEMARVNSGSPGVAYPVSPRLAGVLASVLPWITETGGAFDPRIGSLVEAWDLRGEGRRPSAKEFADAREASGPDAILFEDGGSRIRRVAHTGWVDSGAFGKGVALAEAAAALQRAGVRNALLNFGGQVMVLGDDGGPGYGWPVDVAHPTHREEAAARLRGTGVSVATSSGSERRFEVDGQSLTHVLDPRTGIPVEPWGSATVVSEDPLVADIVSTVLFVMGPEEGWAWAVDRQDVGVLFLIDRDGELVVRSNRAMGAWMRP